MPLFYYLPFSASCLHFHISLASLGQFLSCVTYRVPLFFSLCSAVRGNRAPHRPQLSRPTRRSSSCVHSSSISRAVRRASAMRLPSTHSSDARRCWARMMHARSHLATEHGIYTHTYYLSIRLPIAVHTVPRVRLVCDQMQIPRRWRKIGDLDKNETSQATAKIKHWLHSERGRRS